MNSKEIIGIKEIVDEYNLPKPVAVRYLKKSGLILPRVNNGKIRVFREAWEKWLSTREDER